MSKFCENCGAEINDNDTICPNCNTPVGAKVEEPVVEAKVEETVKTESASTAKKADTKKIAIIGGGIAAAVILILALIISLVSGRYKSPIKKYYKGMNKCDAKAYCAAYPEFMKMSDSVTDQTLKDRKKNQEKTYGDNVKYSYKILKKTKISKSDLEQVKKYIDTRYKENVKVTKGFKVKIRNSIKGKEDFNYETYDGYIYKINGKWVVFGTSPEEARSYNK